MALRLPSKTKTIDLQRRQDFTVPTSKGHEPGANAEDYQLEVHYNRQHAINEDQTVMGLQNSQARLKGDLLKSHIGNAMTLTAEELGTFTKPVTIRL